MKHIRFFSKPLMLAAMLVVSLGLFSSPAVQAAEIAGRYIVAGVNPDGQSSYEGEVVVQRTGGTYAVTWVIDGTEMQGVGLMTYGKEEVFSVAYDAGGASGLAVYRWSSEGNLAGQWTMVGISDVGIETWLRKR